jgi:hypothetical protein
LLLEPLADERFLIPNTASLTTHVLFEAARSGQVLPGANKIGDEQRPFGAAPVRRQGMTGASFQA